MVQSFSDFMNGLPSLLGGSAMHTDGKLILSALTDRRPSGSRI